MGVVGSWQLLWLEQFLVLLVVHHPATLAFRVFQNVSEFQFATRAIFQPYQKGTVGYYGDPSNADPERVNEGSPFSPDTPRIFYTESPKQNCPGMVGPVNQTEYFCTGREYGYCDRRLGLCVCNLGYQGADCSDCEPSYFKLGSLCYPKVRCPNDCSSGGTCDYKTGKCSCFSHRKGEDCSQVYCSFDKLCESCTSTQCLKCAEGYFVTATQTCMSCTIYDPRCLVCNQTACLECADPLLNSVRRSGARKIDAALPFEEATREFSFKFSYGSQYPRVFDEAEHFFVVPSASSTNPLNQNTKACVQGLSQDASWSCSNVAASHIVCGHFGTITFDAPLYAVNESSASVFLTLVRTGGGVGNVSVEYELLHRTTNAEDVSGFAFYKSYQTLVFREGVVQLSFEIPIYDDRVYEPDEQFEVVLKNPSGGAIIGNQKAALVTIIDDDANHLDPLQSYVINGKSTLLAGGVAGRSVFCQIQAVSSLGKLMTAGGDLFVVETRATAIDGTWNESVPGYGTVTDLSNGVYSVTWTRQLAGLYDVSISSVVPGGLRGEYYDDPWFDAPCRLTRIDRHVNFTWGTGFLFDGAQDFVGIRWSGMLRPKESSLCTFYVEADDDFRLFIDHMLVLDYWTFNDNGFGQTQMKLDASVFYEIVLEYRDLKGEAHVKLFWSSPNFAKEIIPAAYLYSKTLVTGSVFRKVPIVPNGISPKGTYVEGSFATTAGVPLTFFVHARDVYGNLRESIGAKDQITATATLTTDRSNGSTGSKVEDARIVYNTLWKRFEGTLTPQLSGFYNLNVYVYPTGTASLVSGSPFVLQVTPNTMHATQSVVTGAGITASHVAGVVTSVTVTARDAYFNRIWVGGSSNMLSLRAIHTTATNTIEMGTVVDNGDGTYRIDYTPRIIGAYKVYVYLNDTTVNNSPYTVSVVTNDPYGATSIATGNGLSTATTFIQTSFVVTTHDVQANTIQHGGASISWTLKAASSGHTITGNCTDLLNGQYSCPYTAQVVGVNLLSVFINQNGVATLDAIQSSPFTVQVIAGPALGSNSYATGSGLVSSVVGTKTLFSVFIRDHFANDKVNAGTEAIQVNIAGTTPANAETQSGSVVYLANGEYQVTYVVYKTGSHTIAVTVNGVAIQSSPFTFYAYPNVASYTTTSLDLTSSSTFVAGQPVSAVITTRDVYGNVLEGGGYGFRFDTQVRSFTSVVDANNGSYFVTLTPTKARLHQVLPQLLVPGGLNGSYFVNDGLFGTSKLDRIDPALDFDFDVRNPSGLDAQSTFSIVWKGFLKPLYSELYTFDVVLQGGMTLQIDNETVLDAWNGLADAGSRTKGRKLLEANTLVAMEIRFRKNETLHQLAKLQVFWQSLSQIRQIIPSAALFTQWRIVNNLPALNVAPAPAFGPSFTSASQQGIAGTTKGFDVIARDQFGNRKPLSSSEQLVFRVYVVFPQLPVDRNPLVQIDYLGNAIFRVNLVPTLAGNFSMVLAATDQPMYNETGRDALLARLEPFQLDGHPFWLTIQPNEPLASTSTAFGDGFEHATAGANAVFFIQIRDSWGNQVPDARTQVMVELRATGVTNGGGGEGGEGTKVVVVVPASTRHIESGKFEISYVAQMAGDYQVFLSVNNGAFVNKPGTNNNPVEVQPNVSCATTSKTFGPGTSGPLVVGVAHAYQVVLHDAFGNLLTHGGNNLLVVAKGPVRVAGDWVDLQNGQYVVTFVLPMEGMYELQTQLISEQHGLTGLYFADDRFGVPSGAAVRSQVDPQINWMWSSSVPAAAQSSSDLSVRQYMRIRWKGFLKPRFTESYVFTVQLMGNCALYIDDQVVVDTLNAGSLHTLAQEALSSTTTSGTIALVGNRVVRITIEYRNPSSHFGQLVLFWQSARQPKEIVPSQVLFPHAMEIQPRYTILATTSM